MVSQAVDPEENRAILALRCKWPAGALEAVRAFERANPGWAALWSRTGHPDFHPIDGYYACTATGWRGQPSLYGDTIDALQHAVTNWSARHPPTEYAASYHPYTSLPLPATSLPAATTPVPV